jgi:hypothetical protein
MSTAADRLKAKADRLRAQQHTVAESVPAGEAHHHPPAAAPVHTKPIRSTVDLPPVHHAQLKAWCGETAVELGQSRVTTQDVLRALVARLLTDPALAKQVKQDILKAVNQ